MSGEYVLYNQLTWTLSPSPEVIGYFIYRDGMKIATVDAATDSYRDRPRAAVSVYSVIAFDSDGTTSAPMSITIP